MVRRHLVPLAAFLMQPDPPALCPWGSEVVCKTDNQVGFPVIARRWVVERFFARINRNRRLAKNFEAAIGSVEAFLYAASSVILLRRLAR